MKKVDGAFDGIRSSLNTSLASLDAIKTEIIISDNRKIAELLIRVSTDCSLFLDRFMEIVWKKLTASPEKNPYIYFPIFEDENKFKRRLRKYGLEGIDKDEPELFSLIRCYQPFVYGQSWLSNLHNVASERHSDPSMIYQPYKGRTRYIHMPSAIGETVTVSYTKENGDVVFHTIERYGIPDRDPPKLIIKSQDEALAFIETCLIETNNFIASMIDCFEKKL